jgi:hypothetical protein
MQTKTGAEHWFLAEKQSLLGSGKGADRQSLKFLITRRHGSHRPIKRASSGDVSYGRFDLVAGSSRASVSAMVAQLVAAAEIH